MLPRLRRSSVRRCGTVVVILAIVALGGLRGVSAARADGDPASDVLVTQSVFVPLELTITRQTNALEALLAASGRAGFPIRVALIDSAKDLGTVTALWRRPVAYARYLGTELSLAFHGQVAVVMPNGIGIDPGPIAPTAGERAVAAGLAAPGAGPALVTAAIAAVRRLAAAAGHPLPVAALRVAGPAPAASGSGASAWLALVAGVVLVVIAWGASLRARPLDLRRRRRAAA